ncbi:hypothetical protein 1 [Hubei sobemo-like virus 11]|uniref:hypothetical protein 1 n=1 Tax=Hubei sobemo-like virus 11 TaxID=1923196 RepID=UPI00090C9FB2|nr:hypothetical protein 1 [Hubei sobemo-like virus 11]APG75833.1 hypothetical protein 1 [Hubei sobemo-like virus 11]
MALRFVCEVLFWILFMVFKVLWRFELGRCILAFLSVFGLVLFWNRVIDLLWLVWVILSGLWRVKPVAVAPEPVSPASMLLWWFIIVALLGILMLTYLLFLWVFVKIKSAIVGKQIEKFAFERYQEGSPYLSAKCPDVQCEVWVSYDGDWLKSGQAFRVGDKLITAGHVVREARQAKFVSGAGEVFVDVDSFAEIEGDVVFVRLSNLDITTLALKSAKFANVGCDEGKGTFCTVQAFGRMSMGMVESFPAFGFCKYTGSTDHGFSGAPYLVNRTVFGVHIGTQGVNLGYEGAYVAACLRSRNEDSEEYLMKQVKKGRGVARQSPYDPDEVQIQVGGKYFTMSRDAYEQAQEEMERDFERKFDDDSGRWGGGKNYHTGKNRGGRLVRESALERSEPLPTFDDVQSEPKNVGRIENAGVSISPKKPASWYEDQEVFVRKPNIQIGPSTSTPSTTIPVTVRPDMVLPESIAVPRRNPSSPTSKNAKKQAKALQREKLRSELLTQLGKALGIGDREILKKNFSSSSNESLKELLGSVTSKPV